jgi:hypothetical protein
MKTAVLLIVMGSLILVGGGCNPIPATVNPNSKTTVRVGLTESGLEATVETVPSNEQLAITNAQLLQSKNEIALLKTSLEKTNRELAISNDQLSKAKNELFIASAQLSQAKNENAALKAEVDRLSHNQTLMVVGLCVAIGSVVLVAGIALRKHIDKSLDD